MRARLAKWDYGMRLSRAVTETALLLKKRTPRLYATIRNNAPHRLRSIINEKMTVDSLGADSPKQVFTNIFRRNWWNNSESRSGWGAELNRTVSVRAELKDFAHRHSIRSLLDAPCGDFHWMRHVDWPSSFKYIGADIVHDLIIENRRKYPSIEFLELDVLQDHAPGTRYWGICGGSRVPGARRSSGSSSRHRCMACARFDDSLSRRSHLDRHQSVSAVLYSLFIGHHLSKRATKYRHQVWSNAPPKLVCTSI